MDRINMKKSERLGFFDTKGPDYVKIGSFRKLHVYVDQSVKGYIDVDVVDPTVQHGRSPQRLKRVLTIQLSITEFKAFHIDLTKLDKTYSGRGIAAQAYRYIIKKLGITLQAGSVQSKGGRKVWFDLAQVMDLAVYAKSRHSKAYDVGIDTEEREVWLPSGKEIYDGVKEMFVFAKPWAA
jgi:hypothetical protein|tara:strand:+ start:315 stop:854 length:540 start_codon:yes stop_codon:yes gene_type:complete